MDAVHPPAVNAVQHPPAETPHHLQMVVDQGGVWIAHVQLHASMWASCFHWPLHHAVENVRSGVQNEVVLRMKWCWCVFQLVCCLWVVTDSGGCMVRMRCVHKEMVVSTHVYTQFFSLHMCTQPYLIVVIPIIHVPCIIGIMLCTLLLGCCCCDCLWDAICRGTCCTATVEHVLAGKRAELDWQCQYCVLLLEYWEEGAKRCNRVLASACSIRKYKSVPVPPPTPVPMTCTCCRNAFASVTDKMRVGILHYAASNHGQSHLPHPTHMFRPLFAAVCKVVGCSYFLFVTLCNNSNVPKCEQGYILYIEHIKHFTVWAACFVSIFQSAPLQLPSSLPP